VTDGTGSITTMMNYALAKETNSFSCIRNFVPFIELCSLFSDVVVKFCEESDFGLWENRASSSWLPLDSDGGYTGRGRGRARRGRS